MKKNVLAAVLSICLLMGATACSAPAGESGSLPAIPPVSTPEEIVAEVVPLEGVSAPAEVTLVLPGEEPVPLAVKWRPAAATGLAITYASSDESIVTVCESGNLTAVGEGEASVTVTMTGEGAEGPVEKTATTKVVVKALPLGFGLESIEGLLYVGHSFRLKPYRVDVEGNPDETAQESTYTFASSDEAVGTVDAEGITYGAGVGTCTITITNEAGQTLEYSLTVVKAPPPRSTGGSGTGESGAAGGGATPGTPAAPGEPVAPPADGGGGGGTPAAPPADGGGGGGTGQGNPNGGNPNGDGSPGNPIDSGTVTPSEDQGTNGISPNW